MFRRLRTRHSALLEPHWARLSARRLPGVPGAVQAWLADPGSLTRAVVARCPRRFAVELLRQAAGSAMPGEAALLAAGRRRTALVREVRLNCGRETWVFARTVMPLSSRHGPASALTRLGQRPLGEVLFSDPTTRRLRVEVARITPRHRLFEAATAHLRRAPVEIWGRRTLFEYRGERILVNELFLPAIPGGA
jgi:chorismate--pyruvate lyase